MGNGYWILIWDSWGSGLVMVNPRLYTEGFDLYNNRCNWFSCDKEMTDDEIIKKHKLDEKFEHFKIIR